MGRVEPIRYDDPAGQLPAQCDRSRRDTPEMRLWFRVLCQALEDACGAPRDCAPSRRVRAHRLTTAARAWVDSNANRPGSFRWCCEIFELDVDMVRARLKAGRPITFDLSPLLLARLAA
jgi:hypothetical protein